MWGGGGNTPLNWSVPDEAVDLRRVWAGRTEYGQVETPHRATQLPSRSGHLTDKSLALRYRPSRQD